MSETAKPDDDRAGVEPLEPPSTANLNAYAENSFSDDEMLSDVEIDEGIDARDLNNIPRDYVPAAANALELDHASFRNLDEVSRDVSVSDKDYAKYFAVPPQLESEWALDAEEHNRLFGRAFPSRDPEQRMEAHPANGDIRKFVHNKPFVALCDQYHVLHGVDSSSTSTLTYVKEIDR